MITAQGRSKALVSAVLQILFICLFASSVTASIPSIVNPSAVYNTAQVAPANERLFRGLPRTNRPRNRSTSCYATGLLTTR